jgi:hypothetical protein
MARMIGGSLLILGRGYNIIMGYIDITTIFLFLAGIALFYFGYKSRQNNKKEVNQDEPDK